MIRPARTTDAAALVALFADWGHPLDEPAIAERVATWAATPQAALLIAEPAVGFVAVAATPHLARRGGTTRVAALVVGVEHRRRGLGRALLEAAEAQARAWGSDRVELTSRRSRTEAHGFYPAVGYRETSGSHARYVRDL